MFGGELAMGEARPACLKKWRERMASEAGKAVYALRQRIERIIADRKNPVARTMALVFSPFAG